MIMRMKRHEFTFISNRILLFLVWIMVLSSCDRNRIIEVRNPEGKLVMRIHSPSGDTLGPREGLYEFFDEQERLSETSHYQNGKLHGERKVFENGVLYAIENYHADLFEGPYQVFYPDGALKLEATYVNNEMTGPLKGYYPDGKIKEEVTMSQNEENGPFREFYPDGKIKAEGSYLNGPNEHGELKLYDSTGVHIRTMLCEEGVCRTQWTRG
jgi:antitoxin component YwqK of YwqJK toxin-antitoxin module